MRVFMFQDRFAPLVAAGVKRQTIRKTARCKVGDTISLRRWSGKPYRSKQAVLREAVVERVREVEINHYDVFVDDERYPGQHLAALDGFKNFEEMRDWFSTVHGLPFHGHLIRWEALDGSCGRAHEECYGCALRTVVPAQCSGHQHGPVECPQFRAANKELSRPD